MEERFKMQVINPIFRVYLVLDLEHFANLLLHLANELAWFCDLSLIYA